MRLVGIATSVIVAGYITAFAVSLRIVGIVAAILLVVTFVMLRYDRKLMARENT